MILDNTMRYRHIICYMSASKDAADESNGQAFSGRDVLYRGSAIGLFDVQRAADALLRQGTKPSVAAIREQMGGGSPNTITPLLARYWESLGKRLGAESESLERVPEALARVTELMWRRALEEARARLKSLGEEKDSGIGLVALQEQVMALSVALAEARAREGEQLAHLAALSKEHAVLRADNGSLLALLRSTQTLLEQQNLRVHALESSQTEVTETRAKRVRVGRATSAKKRPIARRANAPKKRRRPKRVK